MDLPGELVRLLDRTRGRAGPVVVLTGAGISAESGIPTFRGPGGYWTVGSRNGAPGALGLRPEQLATLEAFRRWPEEVWSWYFHRRSVCRRAAPNPAHLALARLEGALGDDFLLVTQNVDGLHLRAGSTPERTYQIHGNLDFVRCADGCSARIEPFPAGFEEAWDSPRRVGSADRARLCCARCGGWLRPHVLWFDECYDEERYRFVSSLRAADTARLLLVIGTSGATNLPTQMCERVFRRGAPLVVVNQDPSRFSELAARSEAGFFAPGGTAWVVAIAARLEALAGRDAGARALGDPSATGTRDSG